MHLKDHPKAWTALGYTPLTRARATAFSPLDADAVLDEVSAVSM